MSASIFLSTERKKPVKKQFLAVSCWCQMKKPALIGSLAFVIEKPYTFTTLNIMGGFFLLFDVTMDVSQDKCILGKLWESPVTRTTHIRPDVIHCDVMDCSRGILCENVWQNWSCVRALSTVALLLENSCHDCLFSVFFFSIIARGQNGNNKT